MAFGVTLLLAAHAAEMTSLVPPCKPDEAKQYQCSSNVVQKVWLRIANSYDLAIRVDVKSVKPHQGGGVAANVYISEGYAPFDFANMHYFLFSCDGLGRAVELYPRTYEGFLRHDVVRAIEGEICPSKRSSAPRPQPGARSRK